MTFCAAVATSACFSSPSNTEFVSVFLGYAHLKTLTESQLFQGPTVSLGEEEIDENNFKAQPAHVDEQVFPIRVLESDRINKAACHSLVPCDARSGGQPTEQRS